MQAQQVGTISMGQDGAIANGVLFRCETDGIITAFDLETLSPLAAFRPAGQDAWVPHSNCCFFGHAKAAEEDDFPLFYTNVYNTYQNSPDRREGVLLAYRIMRRGTAFSAALWQIIRIGFVEDRTKWKSLPGTGDVRPYGNFVEDTATHTLYAFTMRDRERVTRFFSFPMPAPDEGEERDGTRTVVLQPEDIRGCFDTPYQEFLQGGCCRNGVLYSLEGFGDGTAVPGRLRRIDLAAQRETDCILLHDCGLTEEPEWIAFAGDDCYFSDATNQLYRLTF